MNMTFPYGKFKEFVENIKGGQSFLTPKTQVTLDKKILGELINLCENNDTAERRMEIISGKVNIDPNLKLLLLHAYWLWTYPFGFGGERKFYKSFANLYDNINSEHTTFEASLSSMGGYGQRMHDEILWILKNVFSLIIDTENFKDFKEQAINTWSNNKESVSTRNLLLHVLDSKNYESIAKQDEKNRIVDAFKSLIPADHSNDGVDPKLQIIREKLGMKNDESFYNSQYNIYWKNDLSTPAKKLELSMLKSKLFSN